MAKPYTNIELRRLRKQRTELIYNLAKALQDTEGLYEELPIEFATDIDALTWGPFTQKTVLVSIKDLET